MARKPTGRRPGRRRPGAPVAPDVEPALSENLKVAGRVEAKHYRYGLEPWPSEVPTGNVATVAGLAPRVIRWHRARNPLYRAWVEWELRRQLLEELAASLAEKDAEAVAPAPSPVLAGRPDIGWSEQSRARWERMDAAERRRRIRHWAARSWPGCPVQGMDGQWYATPEEYADHLISVGKLPAKDIIEEP